MQHSNCLLLLLLVFLSASVRADWINLTGAETSANIVEIYVMDDHVRLVLEVYIGDLDKFEELVPDDWIKDTSKQRPDLSDRLGLFSQQKFQFITETGEKLGADLKLAEPRMRIDRMSPFAGMINPYTRQRVPEAPADKRVLYAELIYPFTVRPETLTIIPPLDDEGRAMVTIGFIVYHKSVPVIDFRYLGMPAHLNLDWDDPWYSRFDNPNLKRHHKSALMSYLYVEPYEVRHEILTRVRDLEQWMELGLRNDEFIETDELDPLRQRIGEFLLSKNVVRVDGQLLKPVLDRSNYVKVSLKGIQLLEKPERLETSTAIVGVIFAYLTEGMPQQVTVDWELFTDQVQQVPTIATDPAGPLPSYVTPDDNILTWTNFLKNYQIPVVEEIIVAESITRKQLPLFSIICLLLLFPVVRQIWQRKQAKQPMIPRLVLAAGLLFTSAVSYPLFSISVPVPGAMASNINNDEARVLLSGLLKNVYRAFDFRKEEDVYDKLAMTVSGDLLTDIYLQNRRSFAIQQAGGAQARIKEIEIQGVDLQRLDGRPLAFTFKAQWTAMGSVGHWGHIHMRKNYYNANITIDAIDNKWKITGLELLEEKRVEPFTQIGKKDEKMVTDQNTK